jgi:hypothetical protein
MSHVIIRDANERRHEVDFGADEMTSEFLTGSAITAILSRLAAKVIASWTAPDQPQPQVRKGRLSPDRVAPGRAGCS